VDDARGAGEQRRRQPRADRSADRRPGVAGAALAQGSPPTHTDTSVSPATVAHPGPPILLKTTDGATWSRANTSAALELNQNTSTIAVAPSSSLFQTYYVGVTASPRAAFGSSSLTIRAASVLNGLVEDTVQHREVIVDRLARVAGAVLVLLVPLRCLVRVDLARPDVAEIAAAAR
jgi:hypothetical protein